MNEFAHRPSGSERKVIDPGTEPADTPDNFLLRSLTTVRSSDQDFRGTVLSGVACCSPPNSLLPLVVSIFSIRCCRAFREVIRRPADTTAAVSCRKMSTAENSVCATRATLGRRRISRDHADFALGDFIFRLYSRGSHTAVAVTKGSFTFTFFLSRNLDGLLAAPRRSLPPPGSARDVKFPKSRTHTTTVTVITTTTTTRPPPSLSPPTLPPSLQPRDFSCQESPKFAKVRTVIRVLADDSNNPRCRRQPRRNSHRMVVRRDSQLIRIACSVARVRRRST